MYRVELKGIWAIRKVVKLIKFLMYRVELKVGLQQLLEGSVAFRS